MSLHLQNGGVALEHFNPDSLNTGLKLTYYCNDGYLINGSPVSICTSDGEWSDTPPKCESKVAL